MSRPDHLKWKFQRDAAKSRGERIAGPVPPTVVELEPEPRPAQARNARVESHRPAGEKTLHERLVDKVVVKHGLERVGFMQAIRKALGDNVSKPHMIDPADDGDDGEPYLFDEWKEYREEIGGIVPDAFKIDSEAEAITVYEVEVTSPVSPAKMDRLIALYWIVNEWYWDVRLVVVDRFGNESPAMGMFTQAIATGKARNGMPPVSEEFIALLAEQMGCSP